MTRRSDLRWAWSFERFIFLVVMVLRKTIGRLIWFERIAFYESDIKVHVGEGAVVLSDIVFVVPTPDELLAKYVDRLEADFHIGSMKLRERLARSHAAVLAVCGTAPVAMVWLAFTEQKVSEIGRTLVLKPHEVITYDAFTLPAWRGRGISPSMNRFVDQYAAKRNATRRITWRRVSNAPAIRVAEKLGHKLLAVATTVRLAGRWHPFVLGLDSAEPPLEFRRH